MAIGNWEERANKNPFGFAVKGFFYLIAFCIIVAAVLYGLGWFSDTAQVAKEEFGPRAALQKYEWFVDQANRIKKMDADIKLFKQREEAIDKTYDSYGKDRAKWAPDIRVQYNREAKQVTDDRTAIVSQRNNLVQEYNAASEKFNWAPFNTRDDKPAEKFESLE